MTAALLLFRQASFPLRLRMLAAAGYALVFATFVSVRQPGLGIGQGFYIPIVLASLGGTLLAGVGAGLVAAVLYELGLLLSSVGGGFEASSLRSGIHLIGYVVAGAIVGYFAARARSIVSDALHMLEDLLHVARRDLGTGALNSSGLDQAVAKLINTRSPFTLLVGEIDCPDGDDGLRRVTTVLLQKLGDGAELARIGPAQLAVITAPTTLTAARATADTLERSVEATGCRASFGWTVQPTEGTDAWSLFRAANERLYARRIVRGEWNPTPAAAGLVAELIPRA